VDPPDPLEDLIRGVPFFKNLDRVDIARVVLLAGSLLGLRLLFPPEISPKVTADVLGRQHRVLAALSTRERVAAAAAVVLLGGLLAQPVLHVDTPWLALAALAVAMMGSGLDRARFRSSIDWGFLVLFGVLLGTDGVLRRVGVDQWVARLLVPVIDLVHVPGVPILMLALVAMLCRLVLQRQPATLLLSLALIPAAAQLGLRPWIVGFVILVAANTWVHPYQSDWYRMLREMTAGEAFTGRHGVIIGGMLTVLTLLALAASIPYWRLLGLL
jgi:di/tricarboxylate transporter